MQRGPLSDARLLALASEIGDGTVCSETDWLEWKRELDLTTKRARFQLSKHILGMANRLPGAAQRNCEGYGYIFIGVEGGSMPGTPQIDPAQLHDWINPYIGATGPKWRHRYLQSSNVTVLAIEVDPPRSGDSIHTLRRAYENSHRGMIFVRKSGKTHPAEPGDIENLEGRARGNRLDMDFGLAGAEQISWFECGSFEHAVGYIADRERSSQLTEARHYNRPTGSSNALETFRQAAQSALCGNDKRSLDTYEDQVDEWHAEWLSCAPQHWIQKYMEAGHGVYTLQLANLTDENFSSVQVRLQLEEVHIVDEISPASVDLPTKPTPFGREIGLFAVPNLSFPLLGSDLSYSSNPATIYVTHSDGNAELVWEVGHLRPEETVESDKMCILVNAPRASNHLSIHWMATSTSVNGVKRGILKKPLTDDPILLHDIEHDLGR